MTEPESAPMIINDEEFRGKHLFLRPLIIMDNVYFYPREFIGN